MKIVDLLGGKAEYYLNHTCKTIDKQLIHIPGPDMIDKVWMNSDRNIRTLESLQALYGHGRLANTGLCIHSACRPGHRTFCRSVFRPQSALFRSRKHHKAGH